jgi:hypothetical protein
VDLKTKTSREEQTLMGHCGNSDCKTLYSIRKFYPETGEIQGICTISVIENGYRQAKGQGNHRVPKKYDFYVVYTLLKFDLYTYKPEYQSSTDVSQEYVKQYIEENREQFSNIDEETIDTYLENLTSNTISLADFERVMQEEKTNSDVFSAVLDDDDEGSNISVHYAVDIYIQEDDENFAIFKKAYDYYESIAGFGNRKSFIEELLEYAKNEYFKISNGEVLKEFLKTQEIKLEKTFKEIDSRYE